MTRAPGRFSVLSGACLREFQFSPVYLLLVGLKCAGGAVGLGPPGAADLESGSLLRNQEGCLWPSESTVSGSGIPEPQVYAPPRPTDRLAVPAFAQRDRFHRFQPTYPYLQHEIDLPPTISLSDGEEPPPYQGPCTLQLRDPEQQLELNRESVRAPPNRTIFDSDLMDSAMLGGPCPPSSNSGISATCYGGGGRMEGPPPTYSEVIGHYPGASTFQHQQSSGPASLLEGTRLHPAHIAPLESTAAWSKEKDKQKGHPL
ncbi:protein TMEPAI isoform X2 [Orcinus orca]|uniref:protein TMEPAI isoform X2 n=1 Tax=Orcinus orca TaxID=9733 RepID=UPI002112FD9E|nr:protein TMEPAI isoform X2 [Orcinus orca]